MDPKYFQAIRSMYALGVSFTPAINKHPFRKGWTEAPRETLDQALTWAANGYVAVRTGGASNLVIIDVEKEADPTAFESLGLPKTITVKTGDNGFHYYYRYASADNIKNITMLNGLHLDVKGYHGAAAFVGTVHPDTGNLYEFLLGPDQVEMAELPQEFIDKYAEQLRRDYHPPRPPVVVTTPPSIDEHHPYIQKIIEEECATLAAAPKGTRNSALNKSAFELGRVVGGRAWTLDAARSHLLAAAERCGLLSEGREEHAKTMRTLEDALKRGELNPRDFSFLANPEPWQPKDEDAPAHDGEIDFDVPPELIEQCGKPGEKPPEGGSNADDPASPPGFSVENAVRLYIESRRRIVFYRDILYRYTGKCYRPMTDAECRASMFSFVTGPAEQRKEWTVRSGKNYTVETVNPKSNTISNMVDLVRGYGLVDYKPDIPHWISSGMPAANHVVVKNGILNLDTYELAPHNPDCFTLAALPYAYDPDVTCPRFLRFLNEIFMGDEGKIDFLQRMFGYCLQSSQDGQKIFVFIGEGKNGKTVTARVLKMLIGDANCSSLPLEHLDKEHATASLVGKMLNFSMEWKYLEPQAEGTLKAISGGDPVEVNPKFKKSFSTILPTKFVIVSNEPPHIQDRTQGMWRRIVILPFTAVVDEDRRIPMEVLLAEFSKELPGILNFALEGLKQLRLQKGFAETDEMVAARDDYRRSSSSVLSWIEEEIGIDAKSVYPSGDAYKGYQDWCKENGQKALSSNHFGRELKRWYKRTTGGDLEKKRITTFQGERGYQYVGLCKQPGAVPPGLGISGQGEGP